MNTSSFLVSPDGSIPTEAAKVAPVIKVGDIFVGTWGYEACLATFVKVTKVMKTSVKVVELDQIQTGDWTAGTAMPAVNSPIGKEILKKVNTTRFGEVRLKWNSYTGLYKWNGEAVQTYNHH